MNKRMLVLFFLIGFNCAVVAKNTFILTGAPCCGKTSVLRELAKRGYQTCPEAYTVLYEQAKENGALEVFLQHTIDQRWMILKQHEKQEAQLDQAKPAFLDRSIPDVFFYAAYLNLELSHELENKFEEHKNDYELVFFFEPLPKELYYQTEVRYESWDEAIAIHRALYAGYLNSNFNVVWVPFDTVEKRADFIEEHLKALKLQENQEL